MKITYKYRQKKNYNNKLKKKKSKYKKLELEKTVKKPFKKRFGFKNNSEKNKPLNNCFIHTALQN